jgi:hypothetical protein
MSAVVIVENCYTCSNCSIIKKICRLKNTVIQDINKDKCNKYSKRSMYKCEICEVYVVNLKNHVHQIHSKTMEEYKIFTQLNESKQIKLVGRRLF